MKTPLAWLNLWHDKPRTAVAVAGVSGAVVLILMQWGFFNSVRQTATQIYDRLDFDVLIISKQYFYLSKAGTFPRERLYQALSTKGVAEARPLYLGFNLWFNGKQSPESAVARAIRRVKQWFGGSRSPDGPKSVRRGIFVIGLNLEDDVFRLDEVRRQLPLLRQPGHVLMDTRSRKQFGDWEHNDELEIGGRHIQVAGKFTMGTGFGADGDVIVSDVTFSQLVPGRALDEVSLGLVKLAPGNDAAEVAARLNRRFQDVEGFQDVTALTRSEIDSRDRHYWVVRTNVGVILGLGLIVGFLVGTNIVYQVLSSDIAKHMPEYATLKAMGYGPGYLRWVVLQQALILSLVGFVPGAAITKIGYWLTHYFAGIPMELGGLLLLIGLAMSVLICSVSGLIAVRKLSAADPADLF